MRFPNIRSYIIISLLILIIFALPAAAQNQKLTGITLRHTACFGKCPVYQITIYNTGKVVYTGENFTKYTGTYTHKINKYEADSLLRRFASHTDSLQDSYVNPIADLPGIVYIFHYTSGDKQVLNAEYGPDYLKEMAPQIDNLGNVDKTWKKVKPSKKRK